MKTEQWIDANGIVVYQTKKRTNLTKKQIYLTKSELLATKCLISGTVTKHGKVFIAPFTQKY